MRTAKKTVPTLDLFRLAAVLLVVMNHTSPLADVSAMADFWLTRVLARVAVPFFLMTTGYFLSRNHWAGVGRQLKKLCLLYGVCILLYLPVNLYAGSFTGPADVLRKLLVDGTFYHLWYFPATILGIVIARWLSRLGLRVALPVSALLYLIGLGGDSYYGLVSQIPLLRTLYDGIFTLCGYSDYYRPGWRSGDSGRGTGCMLWDDYQRTALPVRHAVTHCFWLKSGREFYKDSGSDFNMNIPLNRNSHQPR